MTGVANDTDRTRVVPGITNFRDFGGMASTLGGSVVKGRLFRSAQMSDLDPATIADLLGYDFDVIVDLRYAGEREAQPSPWTGAWIDRVLAHGGDRTAEAPHLALLANPDAVAADVDRFFLRFYARLPFDALYRPLFMDALRRIAETDGRVLIHCSAGKDRTGVLAALLLAILGVDEDAIRDDYLRTRDSTALIDSAPRIADTVRAESGHRPDDALVAKLLGVEADYLAATFTAIQDEGGSIEAYLDAGGVNADVRKRLRKRFIDKAGDPGSR